MWSFMIMSSSDMFTKVLVLKVTWNDPHDAIDLFSEKYHDSIVNDISLHPYCFVTWQITPGK